MITRLKIRSAGLSVALATVSILAGAAELPPVSADADHSTATVYRSSVSEVRVAFFATIGSNSLTSLSKEDFAVVDDDRVIREFRSFAHSDETALNIVALVDGSESVGARSAATKNIVLQVLEREPSVSSDYVSIVSFGERKPSVLCSGDCYSSEAIARFRNITNRGATPLYDAMTLAADLLRQRRRPGVRPVLILLSDGDDNASLQSAIDAISAVRECGALIYSVDLSTPPGRSTGSTFLRYAAQATGGRYFSPDFFKSKDTERLLNTVLDDLRSSYVVTYRLPDRRFGFHSVRLLPTHNLNLTFHSRNGYVYEPNGQ